MFINRRLELVTMPSDDSNEADDAGDDDDDSEQRLSFTIYEGEREALSDAESRNFDKDEIEQLANYGDDTHTEDR